MATFAIIGGGFSGTVTAIHLLRQAGRHAGIRHGGEPTRVVIINRSGAMARGVAYGTQSDHHVLNVPAGRMSAFDDQPDSFVHFVQQQNVRADGSAFVSRHLYGAYLESLLNDAAARADGARLARVTAEVLDLQPSTDGTHAWLALDDGSRIRADRVVLAVGNYPPAAPPLADQRFFTNSRRYVADPWAPDALAAVAPQSSTLLIGTGLTMIDIVLELRARGLQARCVALSRRGLLPQPHRGSTQAPALTHVPPDLTSGPATAREYLRRIRRHIRAGAQQGVDWRDVLASLRPITAQLWHSWPLDERQRFMRHLRVFWDVHRHRVAPPLYDTFLEMRRTGQVSVIAGRLVALHDADDHVRVRLRPRGASDVTDLRVGTVINCTGPAGDTRHLEDALFRRLCGQGLIRPDPLGLGIECDESGAVIDAEGCASRTLYYVGPFLKARDWEATAVPELRRYARHLAEHLLDSFSTAGAQPHHAATPRTAPRRGDSKGVLVRHARDAARGDV